MVYESQVLWFGRLYKERKVKESKEDKLLEGILEDLNHDTLKRITPRGMIIEKKAKGDENVRLESGIQLPEYEFKLNSQGNPPVDINCNIKIYPRINLDPKKNHGKILVALGSNHKTEQGIIRDYFNDLVKCAERIEKKVRSIYVPHVSSVKNKDPVYKVLIKLFGRKVNKRSKLYQILDKKDIIGDPEYNPFDIDAGNTIEDLFGIHTSKAMDKKAPNLFNSQNIEWRALKSNQKRCFYNIESKKSEGKITGVSNITDHKELYEFYKDDVKNIMYEI